MPTVFAYSPDVLGLMEPLLFSIAQVEPADLSDGMDRHGLADIVTRIRLDLNKKSELRRTISRDLLCPLIEPNICEAPLKPFSGRSPCRRKGSRLQ